jgi:hypothetical protein
MEKPQIMEKSQIIKNIQGILRKIIIISLIEF